VHPTYTDAQYNNTSTAAHFDDIVARPTILHVIERARLGARAH
jgi:hypothetical protein